MLINPDVAPPSNNAALKTSKAIAVSYYNRAARFLPFNSDELWRKRGNLDIYLEMSRDSHIKACVETKKNLLIGQGFEIECENEELKKFVNANFTTFYEGNFIEDMQQVLNAMIYGFSIFEKIYKVVNGKMVLKRLTSIPQDSIIFDLDYYGNVTSINQYANMNLLKPLNKDKFLIMSWNYSNSNPYGNSDLRAAYLPWFAKQEVITYLNMFLERYGMPYIVAKYDSGNEGLRTELEEVIKSLMAANGAVLPAEVDLEIIEVAKQVVNVFIDTIQQYNRDISAALLVPDLMGFNATSGGSYSLGEEQLKIFQLNIDRHRLALQDIINRQVIKQIIDLNFGPQEMYPTIKFKPVEKDLVLDRVDAYSNLCRFSKMKPQAATIEKIMEDLKLPFDPNQFEIIEGSTGTENFNEEENFSVEKYIPRSKRNQEEKHGKIS